MATKFNIDPWYDDFDKSKGFHRILFNPTFAVQARELTQMQTILQNQIEQFGSHVFKQGSMVIPGNSDVELGIQCVKIQPTHSNAVVDFSIFNEQTIIGQSSGIRAYVKKAIPATTTDPITFYLSYLSGGINSELTFIDGEVLNIEGKPSKACSTLATNSNAVGSVAFIKAGVFYVNGFFVYCNPQIEVISKYSATPSTHVLLKIVEETINAAADDSLLDPAQGSYNFAAPGADRYKISLVLTTLPLGSTINDDYIEIMRLEDGVMVEHVRSPKYNELEKSLATRTFEESGNYVVSGLGAKIREHQKKKMNGGVYDGGDSDKFVYNTSSGKAYFQGYPVEKISGTMIAADKARTPAHVKQTSTIVKPTYGQYFFVASATGNLDISNRETVQLWDISSDSGGTQIGTAKVLAIDYHTGDGVNPIYRLFVSDIQFVTGTYDEIGSIRTSSGNFFAKVVAEYDAPLNSGSFAVNDVVSYGTSTRTAMVSFYAPLTGKLYAHRHTITSSPKTGDLIVGPNAQTTIKSKKMVVTNGPSRCIFPMVQSATKSLKNAANAFDLEYTHHVRLTIAAGNTTTATVSGTVVPLEVGTFIALGTAGSDSISNYSLNGTGTAIVRSSPAPAGGITIYAQVNVENATPRTKSPTSFVATKTSATTVLLDHADVYELVSVVVGGVETFQMWTLDTGATDYEYGVSSIKLKDGYTLPSGNLSISYKYFNHTPGDYFTVDSYSGIPNQDIPGFRSPSTGQVYKLRDVIDFRKTYFSPSNIVVSDTIVTTSVQKYIGRIDSLCITKDSKFKVISGTPSESPRAPTIPLDVYELSRFSIPPYTYSIGQILEKRIAVNRYTMRDIKKMDDRLSSLEEFSTLTASEAAIMNTPVIDAATGLDRFKSGYVVESMEDPFGLANVTAPEFLASLNSIRGIYPRVEQSVVDMTLWNAVSNSYRITNGVITLNYTETPLASVDVSSRITNLNPYMVIAWNGQLTLDPPGDVWVDVIDNPEVVNTIVEYQTITNWISIPFVWPPQPAPAPMPPPPAVLTPIPPVITPAPVFFFEPVIVPVPPVMDVVAVAPPIQYGPGTSDVSFPTIGGNEPEAAVEEWTWYDDGMDVVPAVVETVTDGEGGSWSWYDGGTDDGSNYGYGGSEATFGYMGSEDSSGDGSGGE
jgi:hypothetical protein